MSKTAVVTARIDEATLSQLDRIAAEADRSRAWMVGKAIASFVAEEAAFEASLDEAERQIDHGEFVTGDEIREWIDGLRSAQLSE